MNYAAKLFNLWVPVIIWSGCIFFFSSIPDLKSSLEYDFILRKIAHILEYLVLTFLLYRALKGSTGLNAASILAYTALIALLYAATDEMHQFFVPGRSCSFWDFLIDSIGVLIFYPILIVWNKSSLRQRMENGQD